MPHSSTDVLILGAGIAGSALALMLRQRMPSLRVLLVDKSLQDGQAMGETLPPGIRDLLEPLGLWEAFSREGHLPAAGSSAVWGSPLRRDNPFLQQTSAEGWRIDKIRFQDFMLRAACNKGAEVRRKQTATLETRTKEGFRFELQDARGHTTRLSASFVVDATGRNASFAQQMGATKVLHDRLAAVWVACEAPQLPADANSLVETCRDGWWYSGVFPGNKLLAAFLTDTDLIPPQDALPNAWDQWLQAAPHTRARLQGAGCRQPIQIRAAASQHIEPAHGEAWLAVGDAAGTLDPLSSQGIYKALKTGILGAYALEDRMKGEPGALKTYESLLQQTYQAYLETRDGFYLQEQRWAESPFWQRRHHWLHVHPLDTLVAASSPSLPFRQASKHLSHQERNFVLGACEHPVQAQHLVQAYQRSPWNYKTSRNILIGIQHLLGEAQVVRHSNYTNTHFSSQQND